MDNVRTALITGASSGIGAALAVALAAPGVTLHLSGRNAVRLEAVAQTCRGRGVVVTTTALDVCDADAMAAWISGAGHLDLVVANAGISGRSREGGAESWDQTRAFFETNLGGVLNTVLPAMVVMVEQLPGAGGARARGVPMVDGLGCAHSWAFSAIPLAISTETRATIGAIEVDLRGELDRAARGA
jgi:NADP-dependent 3-hydroxy acid dehydrogenase YdfG